MKLPRENLGFWLFASGGEVNHPPNKSYVLALKLVAEAACCRVPIRNTIHDSMHLLDKNSSYVGYTHNILYSTTPLDRMVATTEDNHHILGMG